MKEYKTLLKHLCFGGLVLIITGCSLLKNNQSDKLKLKVLNYGRSSTKLLFTDKDKNMPSGVKRTTDYKLNIIEVTDTIKLHKGVQFGIEYILESPSTKLITLKTIWTYPSIMTNNLGKKFSKVDYEIEKYSNQYTYSNYTLEEPYEMLPGRWNIQIIYNDNLLLNKNFYLVE